MGALIHTSAINAYISIHHGAINDAVFITTCIIVVVVPIDGSSGQPGDRGSFEQELSRC